jgi:hypothetical protein
LLVFNNDISNQQYAAKLFDSFTIALNVSGDSFAHLQEQFDCIYSFWNDVPTLLSAADW